MVHEMLCLGGCRLSEASAFAADLVHRRRREAGEKKTGSLSAFRALA